MSDDKLRILFIAPGCDPRELTLFASDETRLDAMQALVGGNIELVRYDHDIDIFVNEDGLNIGLPPNLEIPREMLLVGNIFCAAHNAQGDTVSLTDAQIQKIKTEVLPKFQQVLMFS